jgi:hypothetical protein
MDNEYDEVHLEKSGHKPRRAPDAAQRASGALLIRDQ